MLSMLRWVIDIGAEVVVEVTHRHKTHVRAMDRCAATVVVRRNNYVIESERC